MQDARLFCFVHMISLSRIQQLVRCSRKTHLILRSLTESMENRLKLFQDIGLSEQKAKETAKNEKLASNLELLVNQVEIFS